MTTDDTLNGDLVLYRTADDAVRVEVLYESETLWLDQRRLAELFGVDVRTVSEHLRNVYDNGELNEEATLRKIRMARTEGRREGANLDHVRAATAHTVRQIKERRAAFIVAAVTGQIDVGEFAV